MRRLIDQSLRFFSNNPRTLIHIMNAPNNLLTERIAKNTGNV
jgi:hypothetical protein